MDVHRCRFVPYPVHAITAAAFTRANDLDLPPGQPTPALRLALGRKNGDIEIWNPQNGQWIQETVFRGEEAGKSVDGLVWTQEPDEVDADGRAVLGQYRLFSFAATPAVLEWNLATGMPARRASGSSSEIWCFAAQPRWRSADVARSSGRGVLEPPRASDIVAGCVNGTLVLLSTVDGELQFKRSLVVATGSQPGCMSIAYQNRERVVAGFMDGIIRVVDMRNGQTIRSMGLGTGVPGAPKSPYVWQVRCLPNGDIVSGDSNGELKFWDGKLYSLVQNVAGHDTDCLDFAVSADGKTIFSGSMDGRLAIFRQATNPSGRTAWAKGTQRRFHDGEVKSVAAYDSKGMSVVVTGGMDISPLVNPFRAFVKERSQYLPSLPQDPPVTSARHARLLVSWWEKSITIWRINRHSSVETASEIQRVRKLVAKMELDIKDKLRSVSISDDGRALVASTSSEVKIFQLRRKVDSHALGIRKLTVPEKLRSAGARLTAFSPNGKWLAVITSDNELFVARVAPVIERPKLLRIVGVVELERGHVKESRQTGFNHYLRSITRLIFASDSSVLATGDLSGNMDTWMLEGQEDPSKAAIDVIESPEEANDSDVGSDASSDSSDDDDDGEIVFYGQRWTDNPSRHRLPKLDSAPIVFTFRPQRPSLSARDITRKNPDQPRYLLWVMTAKHQIHEFDVRTCRLSDWSREHPTSMLPGRFFGLRTRVAGAVWDITTKHERIFLYGKDFLAMLNVGHGVSYADTQRGWKRRHGQQKAGVSGKRLKSSGEGEKKNPMDGRHGIPASITRTENGVKTVIRLDGPSQFTNDAEEDEEEDIEPGIIRKIEAEPSSSSSKGPTEPEKLSWKIIKYNPILGIVPLGNEVRTDPNEALEVIVVERPRQDIRKEES